MYRKASICLLVTLLVVIGTGFPVYAQGELLQNPSFEGFFTSAPSGWAMIAPAGVGSTGHTWPGESRTGASWNLSAQGFAFTMYGYQHVGGLASGTRVQFSAWANVFTCNKQTSCIEGNSGHRVSDQSSHSVTRVGIDVTGGTNPGAGTVVWSGFMSPYDYFAQMAVDATVQGGNGVTVFLNASQSNGMLLNDVYWDDASLTAGSGSSGGSSNPVVQPTSTTASSGNTGSTTGSTSGSASNPTTVVNTPAPQPTLAPVKIYPPQADGSITYIVQSGDTLGRIAPAYNVTVQQIVALNNMASASTIIYVGERLLIKAPKGSTAVAALASPIPATVTLAFAPSAIVPFTEEATTAATVNASVSSASICVTVYQDTGSGTQDTSVNTKLIAGVPLKLSASGQDQTSTGVPDRTITSTANSSSCFTNLAAGSYTVSASPSDPYKLTTAAQVALTVQPDTRQTASFGVTGGTSDHLLSTDKNGPLSSLAAGTLAVIAAIAAVAVGGLGLVALVRRISL